MWKHYYNLCVHVTIVKYIDYIKSVGEQYRTKRVNSHIVHAPHPHEMYFQEHHVTVLEKRISHYSLSY